MKRDEPWRAIVVVRCAGMRIAIPVDAVRKVVAAPFPTHLPDAPAIVGGVVNLHGAPLVVLDPARRGAACHGSMTLDSRIVVVDTPRRRFGLLCDHVEGTRHVSASAWEDLAELAPGVGYSVAGVAGEEDLVVLRDPDTWLTHADEGLLEDALARHRSGAAP